MKALRWILWIVGGVLVLVLAGIAVIAVTFKPDEYKPELTALVKEATGRNLAIAGPIQLKLFPQIGASLARVSLSEVNGPRPFARIDEARFAVALLPLLGRKLVVDRIELRGVQAEIIKHKDGTTNIDDLARHGSGKPGSAAPAPGAAPAKPAAPGPSAASPVQLDVSGILLSDAQLIWKDEESGQSLKLSVDHLATGRIAENVPGELSLAARVQGAQPTVDLNLSATVPYRASFAAGNYDFNGFTLSVEGEAPGAPTFKAKLAGDASLDAPAGSARLQHLSLQLSVASPALAAGSAKVSLSGDAGFNWAKGTATAALAADIDDSKLRLDLKVLDLAKRVFRFDVNAERLDLDRYLPPKHGGASSGQGGTQPEGHAEHGAAPPAQGAAGEQPIDFSALSALDAAGTVSVDALVADGLKVQKLKAKLQISGGHLELAPLSAALYQGRLSAAVRVDAGSRTVGVHEQIADVALGPLLVDLSGKDILEGRANVDMDVTTTGASVGALKRALAGKASLAVRDGAIKGVDLAAIARNASALLGSKGLQDVTAPSSDKTDFTQLTASFVIRNGVAHNDDLLAQSPFLRLTGAGDVDIGRSRLDYLAKAAIIASAAGQGAVQGTSQGGSPASIVIPVRVSGPFEQPRYQVDTEAMVADAAKAQAAKRLQDVIEKNVPQNLQGPLGDTLKGLLGR
jgi:AsmA protein